MKTTDIGIDIGSSKTVIFSDSKIVLEKPSVVTVDADTMEPIYFGEKAKQTMGRTPDSLLCVRPIQNGIIADYDLTGAMLTNYMHSCFGKRIVRPRVMASLPTGVTELQHHSIEQVVNESGGRNVTVVENPIAVAIGFGIDFTKPKGNLIVDMGAGSTDIATLSLGGIAQCDSSKTAGYTFDELIEKYVRKEYNIEIGPLTAEHIKKQLSTVIKRPIEVAIVAKGRNLLTGMPQSFEITSTEIYDVIIDTALSICNSVRRVLEKTDPDLVADIMSDGMYLTGGSSLINGMPELFEEYFGTKVHVSSDPTHSVVRGMAVALKHPELLGNVDFQYRSIKELAVET
ncbi:MAG: rod shape-determining protein [Clostridia bacterium]|nr:rod shape-determining protein [Oscillospiraceae bacterium]MBQ2746622.1 rod shape-determining protein [Clostridia bacterium]